MTVTINTAQVITALNLLQQRTTHLQPAFEQIGAAIQNHITLDYGSYGSNSSVTPVPEPEEWAMMMLGLPVLGFVGRRKKSDKDFNFTNTLAA